MKFAREGRPFILVAAVLALALLAWAVQTRSPLAWVLAGLAVPIALWVPYFFRDPERSGVRGNGLVVAPADGRIVLINEVDEPAFLHARATRISIFMNVFSVHVNRYPVSGTVRFVQYSRGRFVNAAAESASTENEQMSVGIDAGRHRVMMRQIAGLIARRIVTYSREGERVEQGERMGLIRFGSRVDVFVPRGSQVRVALGELTSAGATVLAELPGGSATAGARP
ncbi:MAG TPA: phosphatidylserine decarboxylase family protein [Gemmatirosa sp.]|nr:phosphatidylserine decarboxylase family protein [Gemmatirosa sp.]